jgi:hypothetical protein
MLIANPDEPIAAMRVAPFIARATRLVRRPGELTTT